MRSSQGGKQPRTHRGGKKKKKKKTYSDQQQKEMDCDEPHLTPNEKTQPIQWTERSTGALVAAGSLWPFFTSVVTVFTKLVAVEAKLFVGSSQLMLNLSC